MDLHEEVRRLREDFDQWREAGDAICERMEALEDAIGGVGEPAFVAAARPAGVTAPPALPPQAPPERKPVPQERPEHPAVVLPVFETTPTEVAEPRPFAARVADSVEATSGASQSKSPRRPWPEVPAGPTPWERLVALVKRLGPKEEMSWEMALGTYWLPRIGITIVLIGLVGAMIYKFHDSRWAPHLRIALGYLSCAVLLVLGRWLELRSRAFGRVLLAGGIAMSYFVTFATYFVPLARISVHPAPTLVALGFVVAAWGGVAQKRRSYLIALGVTGLGHMTVALASVELSGNVGAIGALLMLSAASASFLVRNGWFHVAAVGLVGSQLNYALWLYRGPGGDTVLDFSLGMAVAAAFFLIFATAELVAPEGLRRRAVALRWRTLYVSFNTGAFLVLGLILMRGFPFARYETHLFYWALGAVVLGYGCAYLRVRRGDPVFNAYFTKSMALVALGFAVYFDGRVLTLSLAIQALTLLWAARVFGLTVNRVLALAVALVALVHGLDDIAALSRFSAAGGGGWRETVPASLVLASFLALSLLDLRTSWKPAVNWLPMSAWTTPQPYIYAFAAVVLALGYGYHYVPALDRAWAFSCSALILAGAGMSLRARPWTTASLLLSTAAFASGVLDLFLGPFALPQGYSDPGYVPGLFRYLFAVLPYLVLSELSRIGLAGPSAWPRVTPQDSDSAREPLPYGYALAGAALGTIAVFDLCEPAHRFALLAAGALLFSVYAALRPAPALGATGLTVLLPTLAAGIAYETNHLLGSVLLLGVAFLSEQRYLGLRPGLREHQSRFAPYVLYGIAAYFLGVFLNSAMGVPLLAAASVAAGAAVLVLHAHALAWVAVLYFYWATAEWTELDWTTWQWAWFGVALPLLSLAADRFLVGQLGKRNVQGGVLLVLGCAVALSFSDDLVPSGWSYTVWTLIGAAYLLYGARFSVRTACVLALLTGAGATFGYVEDAYPGRISAASLWTALVVLAAFWGLVERGHAFGMSRGVLPEWMARRKRLGPVLAAIPCMFVVLMLPRMEVQLTMAWTFAAPVMFGTAILFRQPWYRYAGLATFGLAIARGLVVDTRALDPLSRTLALVFLGMVLLGVGYAYTRARERSRRMHGEGSLAVPSSPERSDSADISEQD